MKFVVNLLINALLVAFINLRGKKNHKSMVKHHIESQVSTFEEVIFSCGNNYGTSFPIELDVILLKNPVTSYGAKGIVVTGVPAINNCNIFYTEDTTTYLSYRLLGNSTSEFSTSGANIKSYFIYNNAFMPIKLQFSSTTTNENLVTYLKYINDNKVSRQGTLKTYLDDAIKAINLYQMNTNNTLKNKTWELNYLRSEADRLQTLLVNKKAEIENKKSNVYNTEVRISKAKEIINKNKIKTAIAQKTLTQAKTELNSLQKANPNANMIAIRMHQTTYFKSLLQIKSILQVYMEEAANKSDCLKKTHQNMSNRKKDDFEKGISECLGFYSKK
jgi:hypothetical protein